ncbi:GntR family transcriptional regulator [Pseudaquidulcibacter saccharophilus]|uniref:GntR family transcriptional regulator n=1 Tax=Pseudaquidulcibacter saccharophilus TaxID=2831900 RepID=UPI001EFF4371|nr:GntR family transcriptional regulator [Pseudaquidulcibacter saccharophilus]
MSTGISIDWRDDIPIWKQIKDRLQSAILSGDFKEGEAIPSVRQLAIELAVNPLTVSRAFSELNDDGLIEKRRGLGMFVTQGTKGAVVERERKQFLENEWPPIVQKIKDLEIDWNELAKDFGEKHG